MGSIPDLRVIRLRFSRNLTDAYVEALYNVLRSNQCFECIEIAVLMASRGNSPLSLQFLEALKASDPGHVELDLKFIP